jgi:hypothetical protein
VGRDAKSSELGGFWPASPKFECSALGLGLVKKKNPLTGGHVIGVVDEG